MTEGMLKAALDKAVRARRLYQANNPVYQGFLTALHEAIARLWEKLTSVSVGVDEQAFRFNQRTSNDAERFSDVISHVVGRRLTYDSLTAALNAGNAPE